MRKRNHDQRLFPSRPSAGPPFPHQHPSAATHAPTTPPQGKKKKKGETPDPSGIYPPGMCNNIFWRFTECGHRVLQNTFPCHIVRRCGPNDDMLLAEPVFLPQRLRVPPGLLDCRQRTLLKGRDGLCPDCERARAREAAAAARRRERATSAAAAAEHHSSSSSSSGGGRHRPAAGLRMVTMPVSGAAPLDRAIVTAGDGNYSAGSSIASGSLTALAVSSSETLVHHDHPREGRQGRSFSDVLGLGRRGNKTREETPSPDADAVSDMRKGFERITMLQQCTPEKHSRDM